MIFHVLYSLVNKESNPGYPLSGRVCYHYTTMAIKKDIITITNFEHLNVGYETFDICANVGSWAQLPVRNSRKQIFF